MGSNWIVDWFLRMIKGVLIGTGFVLPGVSGGALAAIFGLYERMISFMAHLTKNFWENVLFFIPVGAGMLVGIVILSYPLGFFLNHYSGPTIWFFIGAIIGTFPVLWREAGKRGRQIRHIVFMIGAAVLFFACMQSDLQLFRGQTAFNQGKWIFAGGMIALGVLLPGLSPSNFLLYAGMYGDMMDAFRRLDLMVLLPIAGGAMICLFGLSKIVDMLFVRAYSCLFHIILGMIITSTFLIVPLEYPYLSFDGIVCLISCMGGIILGDWMGGLENQYKSDRRS